MGHPLRNVASRTCHQDLSHVWGRNGGRARRVATSPLGVCVLSRVCLALRCAGCSWLAGHSCQPANDHRRRGRRTEKEHRGGTRQNTHRRDHHTHTHTPSSLPSSASSLAPSAASGHHSHTPPNYAKHDSSRRQMVSSGRGAALRRHHIVPWSFFEAIYMLLTSCGYLPALLLLRFYILCVALPLGIENCCSKGCLNNEMAESKRARSALCRAYPLPMWPVGLLACETKFMAMLRLRCTAQSHCVSDMTKYMVSRLVATRGRAGCGRIAAALLGHIISTGVALCLLFLS